MFLETQLYNVKFLGVVMSAMFLVEIVHLQRRVGLHSQGQGAVVICCDSVALIGCCVGAVVGSSKV